MAFLRLLSGRLLELFLRRQLFLFSILLFSNHLRRNGGRLNGLVRQRHQRFGRLGRNSTRRRNRLVIFPRLLLGGQRDRGGIAVVERLPDGGEPVDNEGEIAGRRVVRLLGPNEWNPRQHLPVAGVATEA